MSRREIYRGEVIQRVVKREITQSKACEELCLCLRQIKRLCKKYQKEGLAGLAHRNRGKHSSKKISSTTRESILELIKEHYTDFGPQLIKEQLEERHSLVVSREWIRLTMIKEGTWHVKKRKHLRYYQRRNRRTCEGALLQIDGSPDDWFEGRGPRCCLLNMVDDATGKISCRFEKEECLDGYFKVLKNYIEIHGRPLAVYSDRHTIFKSPKSDDQPRYTQFGRSMKELGIDLIHANSPQAKGRVERSHATLQDRLIKLMRLEGISSIEEGNAFLKRYVERHNKRFGRKARDPRNAHKPLWEGADISKILCVKSTRKVSRSLEINYKNKIYKLNPKEAGRLRGKTVRISESSDKIVSIEFESKEYSYELFQEEPYVEHVKDRKKLDAFLDRKQPMSAIQRHRKGINVNY